jgi:hypothetical protein
MTDALLDELFPIVAPAPEPARGGHAPMGDAWITL